MESTAAWKSLFECWPEAIPREGMVVTLLNETIPFSSFLISGALLMLERESPDQYGTRKVIIPYEQIAAVRLASVLEMARFHVMGFQPPL